MIAQSFVFAGSGAGLSALLLPATDATKDEIDAEVSRINRDLPHYAMVRGWHRLTRPFTTNNHMLTANGRLRRAQIGRQLPELLAASRTPAPVRSGTSTNTALLEINP